MELRMIGMDIGKTIYHLVGFDLRGRVVVRKRLLRSQLLHFTSNLRVEMIGMEVCGGAHFLGRALQHGHKVRLMSAAYVKPFVKTNKNDYVRCGGDLRSCYQTNDAFRFDQDRRLAGIQMTTKLEF